MHPLDPLDLFAPEGRPGPATPQKLVGEALPAPYRDLLFHERDMTSTLERHHGERALLRVVARRDEGETLCRKVVLYGAISGRPFELGAIRIHLERFAEPARSEILAGDRPLGAILEDAGIAFLSRPRAFFALPADSWIREELGLETPALLYGRRNVLLTTDARPLAEVVEILPPERGDLLRDPEAARRDLRAEQLRRLHLLIREILPANRFYGPRLAAAGITAENLKREIASLDDFTRRLPPTTKDELVADQREHPPYGTNLSYPLERYVRFHQTSGSSGGVPLRWLDTHDSWERLLDTWRRVFEAAGVGPRDRILLAFSFGPFLGFWTAFDAARQIGCLCLPAGGMSTTARLRLLIDNRVTVVCATPTYALHLAETAVQDGIDLGDSAVRALLVAGEPGGSVPAVRRRLTKMWGGAEVFDQHGMTEVGPVSFPNPRLPGLLHIDEHAYLAEIVDPSTLEPVPVGEPGELLLTTLSRWGMPLLRYRTGDLVRASTRAVAALGRIELALEGGILARTDDMVVVRGVNLYPSAVDAVVRAEAEVAEYQVRIQRGVALVEAELIVEPTPTCAAPDALAERLGEALRAAFNLRIPVEIAAPGSLPRYELKARRWIEA